MNFFTSSAEVGNDNTKGGNFELLFDRLLSKSNSKIAAFQDLVQDFPRDNEEL